MAGAEQFSAGIAVPDSLTPAEQDAEAKRCVHALIDKLHAGATEKHLTIDWSTLVVEGSKDHSWNYLRFRARCEAADNRTLMDVLPELLADAERARGRAHGRD